jgi:hypothetical protein
MRRGDWSVCWLTLSWQSLDNQFPSIYGYSAVMNSAGFMWVVDGYADFNPGHYPGPLNWAVAVVHGLLSMLSCVLSADLVRVRSMHSCQLLLERHHLCGVSSQLLEQRPQLPANTVPVRPGKHRAQRRPVHR